MYRYSDMKKEFKEPENLRLQMVKYAKEYGVKPAARHFGCDKNTVKTWLRRYDGTKASLKDKSKAPHNIPHKTPPETEVMIVRLASKRKSFGAERLKHEFDLPTGHNAISRIMKEHGLTRKWRKKTKTKNDLRAVKALWKLFEQVDADTKDLKDIPEYWPLIRCGFPDWQFSARDVVSGLVFTDYAREKTLSNGILFISRVIAHLQEHGVDIGDTTVQTDGGTEFVGSWQASEPSGFVRLLESAGARHRQIPPGMKTYQADIETYNGLVEQEFLTLERFRSVGDLLAKSALYVEHFNVTRKNSYKGWRTPLEIIRERDSSISEGVASWRPVILDDYLDAIPSVMRYWSCGKRGEDVPGYPCLLLQSTLK